MSHTSGYPELLFNWFTWTCHGWDTAKRRGEQLPPISPCIRQLTVPAQSTKRHIDLQSTGYGGKGYRPSDDAISIVESSYGNLTWNDLKKFDYILHLLWVLSLLTATIHLQLQELDLGTLWHCMQTTDTPITTLYLLDAMITLQSSTTTMIVSIFFDWMRGILNRGFYITRVININVLISAHLCCAMAAKTISDYIVLLSEVLFYRFDSL